MRLALLLLVLGGGVLLLVRTLSGSGAEERHLVQPEAEGRGSERPAAPLSPIPEHRRAGVGAPTGAVQEPIAPRPEREGEAAAAEPGSTRLWLTAEVVDEDARPIEGATLLGPFELGQEPLARSDAQGRIAAELVLHAGWERRLRTSFGRRIDIELVAASRLAHRREIDVQPGAEVRLGRVVLVPGSELFGQVVDEGGVAVPEAHIEWTSSAPGADPDLRVALTRRFGARTLSASDGSYRLGVPPGTGKLVAERGVLVGSSKAVTLAARERQRIDLVLRADPRCVAVQVERPDGTPHPFAEVLTSPEDGRATSLGQADETGRWTLRFADEEPRLVRARDAQRDYAPSAEVLVRPGDGEARLRLFEQRWLAIALVDPQGAEIPWGSLRYSFGGTYSVRFSPLTPTDEHGHARIPLPTTRFGLDVMAPGFRRTKLGPFDPASVGEELELVLEPGSFVRGRVSANGSPVQGARIHVQRAFHRATVSKSVAPLDRPFTVLDGVSPDECEATSDADGRFVATLHGSSALVRVTADGFPSIVFGPFEADDSGSVHDLELELTRGGTLTGRVRAAPGRSLEDVLVAISDGWSYAFTRPLDERGEYRFDDLAPGYWQVRPCSPPVGSVQRLQSVFGYDGELPPWDVAVEPGQVTRLDLDLVEFERCVLVGHLETTRPETWTAQLLRGLHEPVIAAAALDATGDFELRAAEAGEYRLTLQGAGIELRSLVRLEPGLRERTFALRTGLLRVEGELPFPEDVLPLLRFRVTLGSQTAQGWIRAIRTDPAIALELVVPAGEGELGYVDQLGAWVPFREVTVEPGEAAVVRFP